MTASKKKMTLKTIVTLNFSANQALLAAKVGGTYISPFVGRLDNIGHDGSGSHCGKTDIFENTLANAVKEPKFTETIFIDERIMKLFRKNYKKRWLPARAINFFLRQIKKVVS